MVYQEREKTPEEVAEDNFDWKQYLLDGEDPIPSFKDDSDSDTDWDDVSDEHHLTNTARTKRVLIDEAIDTHEMTVHQANTDPDSESEAKSAVLKQVIVQYWDDTIDTSIFQHSLDRTSSLVTELKAYLSDSSCDRELSERQIVTEYQLNREFLWLLSGIKESFIFQWDGEQFIPNAKVQLLHLSHNALRKYLLMLCYYGTVIQKLQQFFECVAIEQKLPKVARKPCQTDQAFAAAICGYLQIFKKELVVIEKRVAAQVDTITISNLIDQLSSRLQELELLAHLYNEGIEAYVNCRNNSIRASHLLGVIYHAMLECNTLSDDNQNQVCLLLSLWVKTVKPYLDIIDHWVANGTLEDPCREFIVERNHKVKTRDENYWFESLILHCPANGEKDCPDLNETTSEYSAPAFIMPVINQIVVAGKSTEMLRELGKLQEVSGGMDNPDRSLHHQLTLAIQDFLFKVVDEVDRSSLWSQDPSKREMIIKQLHTSITDVRGMQDPMLQYNFRKILPSERAIPARGINKDELAFDPKSLRSESFPPMQLLLEKCLYPSIQSKYQEVCCLILHRIVIFDCLFIL